jgi:hypothetical protein
MAKQVGGLLGVWDNEHKVLEAARKVKSEGFHKFDTISPFPIHGMDEAMGLRPSKIPIVSFFAGLVGGTIGWGFQAWVFAVDWPLNIGGKPHLPLPAEVPITFELTVLISALTTVAVMLIWNGLPRLNPPMLHPRLHDDKFGLFIPENDQGYNVAKIDKLFQDLGAEEIVKVMEF